MREWQDIAGAAGLPEFLGLCVQMYKNRNSIGYWAMDGLYAFGVWRYISYFQVRTPIQNQCVLAVIGTTTDLGICFHFAGSGECMHADIWSENQTIVRGYMPLGQFSSPPPDVAVLTHSTDGCRRVRNLFFTYQIFFCVCDFMDTI
jgi:hypothetical protein